jgi:hypothetical protein
MNARGGKWANVHLLFAGKCKWGCWENMREWDCFGVLNMKEKIIMRKIK